MNVQTYLYFNGNCAEALEFYQTALGVTVTFRMTYAEGPGSMLRPGWEEKIFHSTVTIGETTINMSDTLPGERTGFGGFALLAHQDSNEEAEHAFSALANEGTVKLPLQQTPWATLYGIVCDKFGITWKVQA